jgi:hypothetical protein
MFKPVALSLALFCCFAVVTNSATAQLAFYGEFNATHDPSTASWYKGFTGGAYDNFIHLGPIRAGLDLRGAYATGNQYGYRDFLLAPRLEVNPPMLPIRPYVQASVGFGGTEYQGTSRLATHYSNKLQYGVTAGLDYKLIPLIDLRVAEVEYLRMSGITSGATAPAINLVTVGTGVVLRLP